MNASTVPSIDQLRELPLPELSISYIPQTWGWLAVLLVILSSLAGWTLWHLRRWHRQRYRREALARLDRLAQALDEPRTRLAALREMPRLLKRVALSTPAGEAAACLRGAAWQDYLQRRCPIALPADFARSLAMLAYAPDSRIQALADSEAHKLLHACRKWIETHHVAV
ncbi:DUF4381 domain-containing protein [Pseudomonas aeruginosa]|uniref:DUF4381 domain-containing protein n=1 Tax=Pseudomonas aeruginosa TaxID=287 RepID=UPI0018DFEC47|nr:DUF4381 domain-containing protein [Pseudomonas aeruginosa]MBI7027860.1 DUF4381 domain-containing protein [Pseudomonas aeruginosa]MBI9170393.1 DUF4381 domain-containing protein [Pseudomonas aeruginosa]MCO4018697.1 DUF4381 domain-containing protein [Pseudomonas aeruginosa]MCY0315714.1 DUF4381 domain-containing protein [Pseudomonas aeruginosa]MCY0517646.1 DUF4381 domain-containing protein [Pseudomonas aeruginosa]